MTAPKLTRPQLALLKELSVKSKSVHEAYQPLIKLIDLGYAKPVLGRAWLWASFIEITTTGRERLANLQPHDLKP